MIRNDAQIYIWQSNFLIVYHYLRDWYDLAIVVDVYLVFNWSRTLKTTPESSKTNFLNPQKVSKVGKQKFITNFLVACSLS